MLLCLYSSHNEIFEQNEYRKYYDIIFKDEVPLPQVNENNNIHNLKVYVEMPRLIFLQMEIEYKKIKRTLWMEFINSFFISFIST